MGDGVVMDGEAVVTGAGEVGRRSYALLKALV
jgi:hypothetical protein